jgi:hypothetical protein
MVDPPQGVLNYFALVKAEVQPLFVRRGSAVRASKNAGRKKMGGEVSGDSRAAPPEPFNFSPLRAAFSFLRL